MKKVGFIGVGNMGSALAKAASKGIDPKNIFLADIDTKKASDFAEKIRANVINGLEVFDTCDMIYLAVKPQMLPEACPPLSDKLKENKRCPLIVTMAAGVEIKAIKEYFPMCSIIRIMPNTPVSVSSGVILYDTLNVTKEQEDFFLLASKNAGTVIKMAEKDIDAASVLSGCGPAFVFLFLDAMAKGGEKIGLDKAVSSKLFAETLIGASKLFLESGDTAENLCRAVCSPGGSTIEGVKKFNELGLDEICEKAAKASFDRTKELGKK